MAGSRDGASRWSQRPSPARPAKGPGMHLVVIVFVVACVVVAWKRSAAPAGHSEAWPRRIRAMGWGILPLPIAIVAVGLFGAKFWTLSAMLASGIAAVLAPVARLSAREREVLALMAEGRSNSAIAERLFVSEKAVGKHSTSIFAKLDLPPCSDDNRRVLAVLAYLNS